MGKQHWEHADDATPNHEWNTNQTEGDWQLAEYHADEASEMFSPSDDQTTQPKYANGGDDDLSDDNQDDDADEDVNEDDEAEEPGDWGHTDPAEGHSPFPDPMDPSGPGSAV